MTRPPVALAIAGSDPSGGAGIQADLKTFSALGAYGCAVLTALTAQSTQGVTGVHVVPEEFVAEQLRTLVDDVRVDAVKVGMLANARVADVVGEFLAAAPAPHVVLDPVMVATSGDRLLDDEAVDAVRRLLPLASVVTPNVPEAAVLLDAPPARGHRDLLDQAHALLDLGAQGVLLKGGHLAAEQVVDVFVRPGFATEITRSRVPTRNTHGTGCSLSSALAALRPQRDSWEQAVYDARDWLQGALADADRLEVGQGHGPVHHFHRWW